VTAQLAFDLGHRPALGAEDFLVAPCNQDAVGWLDRWPDWPAPALVLHGPRGCGKTHLAHVWRNRTNAKFISTEELSNQSPYEILENANACIFDNLAPAQFDQTALFHLYNAARDTNGHLLITSDTPPSSWGLTLNDLRSRLVAAPAVGVGAPDDSVLGAVLLKLFLDRQLRVEPDVLSYILMRMERSFAAANAIVTALDNAGLAARRAITIPLAREILGS
jgi:DnaA regulatory inactivator Hda